MLAFLWLIATVIFFLTTTLLTLHFLKSPGLINALETLKNGFKEGLRWAGFSAPKTRYPIELYVWETMNDEDVCEDCLERASWPPMDIADWMKEGFPGTPEADCECGEECRCRLIRHHAGLFRKKHHKN